VHKRAKTQAGTLANPPTASIAADVEDPPQGHLPQPSAPPPRAPPPRAPPPHAPPPSSQGDLPLQRPPLPPPNVTRSTLVPGIAQSKTGTQARTRVPVASPATVPMQGISGRALSAGPVDLHQEDGYISALSFDEFRLRFGDPAVASDSKAKPTHIRFYNSSCRPFLSMVKRQYTFMMWAEGMFPEGEDKDRYFTESWAWAVHYYTHNRGSSGMLYPYRRFQT